MTRQFVIRVKQLLQGREVVKSFKMNVQNLYIHLQHLQFVSPFRSDSGSQNFCGGFKLIFFSKSNSRVSGASMAVT